VRVDDGHDVMIPALKKHFSMATDSTIGWTVFGLFDWQNYSQLWRWCAIQRGTSQWRCTEML